MLFDRRACTPRAGTRFNRNYSPSILPSKSHRAPETARYIGNTVEKCVVHPAKHEKTPRQTIREICGKIPTRSDNVERSKQRGWKEGKSILPKDKRNPYFSSSNVPHIRKILERDGGIFFSFFKCILYFLKYNYFKGNTEKSHESRRKIRAL